MNTNSIGYNPHDNNRHEREKAMEILEGVFGGKKIFLSLPDDTDILGQINNGLPETGINDDYTNGESLSGLDELQTPYEQI